MKTENTTIRRRITVSVIGASLPQCHQTIATATMAIRRGNRQCSLNWHSVDLMVFQRYVTFKPMTPTEKHEYLRQRGDQVLIFRQTARNQHCYIVFDSYRPPEGGYANSAGCWIARQRDRRLRQNYLTAGVDLGSFQVLNHRFSPPTSELWRWSSALTSFH